MNIKDTKRKERTQKTTLSLNKNLTSLQNQLKSIESSSIYNLPIHIKRLLRNVYFSM